MLQIIIPDTEQWYEINSEFKYVKGQALQLEHSLVSISKWESKWEKPFLSKTPKTSSETLSYIQCMTLTQNVPLAIYGNLTMNNVHDIDNYVEAKMTASIVNDRNTQRGGPQEQITSELIYYWMISLGIPFECQKWHLNRLLMLIKICNFKNTPAKKMSQQQLMSRNSALNAARRAQFNTKG